MLNVDKERVDFLISGLAQFGKNEEGKGITRLAYSKEDRAAQNWLLEQIVDLNLKITEDAVGNVFLLRKGEDASLPPVAMGSHLDTVIQGGAYDGMVGVVGALEIMQMLKDEKLTRGLLTIIFRAEESARFNNATMGSKLMAGKSTVEKLSNGTRKGDISFPKALVAWGCDPDKAREAVKEPGCFDSFWEIHIEQGKVLEEAGEQIGIVKGIAAPTRFKIFINGTADHSGATPMGFRHDALVSAAKLILAVEKAATDEKAYGTVATVGVIEIEPGSVNVVPGKATLFVDLRGIDEASIARALASIEKSMQEVAISDGVEVTRQILTQDKPVVLAHELVGALDEICKQDGVKYRIMPSGAGHDAMHMASLAPTCMVFVPCKGGISHNPNEFAKLEDIAKGIEIMAQAVYQRAR
ncbi:MAG: M20 family metallo-hydrolase [Phascolarctobacterium sp.]|nr:M20 family metallo-hydrolase [Phascolarctobacterium sp.]